MSCSRTNTATRVGLEPPTSGSGVRGVNHQATAPPSQKGDILMTIDNKSLRSTSGNWMPIGKVG